MDKFFKLKENNTKVSTEILAGLTTFFTMAYILFVNPDILSDAGIPRNAVFVATILAAAISTLFMGLFANVPYALAPGMGLNAYFTYTVVLGAGYTWQEALAMVFICGVFNILITVTRIRKQIVLAIPESLQHAIGGGIGVFVAYIGLIGVLVDPTAAVPELVNFSDPSSIVMLIGIVIIAVLLLKKVKGAILIGIILTTIVGIPFGVTQIPTEINAVAHFGETFSDFGSVFGQAFSGFGTLFADSSRYLEVFMMIFAFSLTDTFDTIGTFIGTGRRTGIFSDEDIQALADGKGFESKMDKAMFADAIGTSIGAVLGTSNTTTYVESSAGINEGGRTGLTAVTVAGCFLLSLLFAPVIGMVPGAATAPALVIVGCMMLSSFKEIKWNDLEEAIPAFFAGVFMGLAYSIATGIAFGFMFYIIVKVVTGKMKEIHPIVWATTALFAFNYIYVALKALGIVG